MLGQLTDKREEGAEGRYLPQAFSSDTAQELCAVVTEGGKGKVGTRRA
jgi:hypothetical protein